MPAGRPRKFTEQVLLDGNTRKVSKKDFEAKLNNKGLQVFGDVFLEEYLPDDAKEAVEILRTSMPPGVYCTLDSFLINSFGVAFAVRKKAVENLFSGNEDDNFVAVNSKSGGETLSGWYKVLESSTRLMMNLATQLGLDPRSRMAMMNPEQQPDDQDGLLGNAAHN